MMRKVWLLGAALFPVSAQARAQQPADPAAAFGARDNVQSIAISPNGRILAYVQPAGDLGSQVYTVDLANPVPHAIGGSDGSRVRLARCDFASDARLICLSYSLQQVGDHFVPVSRLVALDLDGSHIVTLGERNTSTQLYARVWSGSVIDYSGGADDSVLMEQMFIPEETVGTVLARTGDGLGVVRLDTRSLRSVRVETPRRNAERFISDGRGHVRLIAVRQYEGTEQASPRTTYLYRRTGRNDWAEFGTFDDARNEGIVPVAVDPTLEVAYAFAKLNGRMALYRVSLDGSLRRELVASNDMVDVDGLLRIGRHRRVVGASYATDRRQSIYFDPELRQIADRLHRALPNQPQIDFVGSSEDESKLLVVAASDNNAGQYYLYDRSTRSLTPVLQARPQLQGVALATVRPVTYPAADGTQIPAYLTLPPNSSGRNIPAIVMPHGGPGSRDEWGFDWLSQFFANRGYAVLQPNFRGSTGYGDSWFRDNGFRSWRVAIGDVNDAGRWLVSQGIADPAKLGIFGWSYGGYAALQANVVDPGLFKAVVAVAPVTDLEAARNEWRGSDSAAVVRDFFGTGPHLREGSPALNAAAFRAPVLLFHGDRDLNVDIHQSRLMDERLRGAGRQSELIVYPGLDHQLDASGSRADMLRRADAFFRRAMAIGEAAAPPGPASAH